MTIGVYLNVKLGYLGHLKFSMKYSFRKSTELDIIKIESNKYECETVHIV